MPKPTKGPRLGSGPTHEKMILGGLAAALIREERIRTTETKGKRLVPVADKLVTLGKQGSVHARRQALRVIEDRDIIHKLFDDIGPRFADRNGGYTRVVKLGPRKGDAAPMVIVEFVEHAAVRATETEEETKKRRGLLRRRGAKAGKATAGTASSKETPEDADEAEELEEPVAPEASVEEETVAEAPEAESTEAAEAPEAEASTEETADEEGEKA